MALCVSNTQVLFLNSYKVAWGTSNINTFLGKKQSRLDHSIRTTCKSTCKHLLDSSPLLSAIVVVGPWLVSILFGFGLWIEALLARPAQADAEVFWVGIGFMIGDFKHKDQNGQIQHLFKKRKRKRGRTWVKKGEQLKDTTMKSIFALISLQDLKNKR